MRRVRMGAGLLCFGLAAASAAIGSGPAHADAPLLSFGMSATAPGSQFTYTYPAATPQPQAEGEVPQSVAQLRSGPVGYALATVAWPGPLVANAGSTSQILNLGLPPSTADQLNEPVRAEARTGSGPPTVTNTSYPGVSMTATATAASVTSDATTAGVSGPAPQSGSGDTETHSTATLTGASTAVATATSVVHDIKLAGGVVQIKSVTSTATATSNGTKATAAGSTVVSGLLIGGQPAYIDQSGLHLGQSGPDVPVNSIASAIANQALDGFGMKVAVSQPARQIHGAQVTYDAGNVVFFWAVPGDSHGDTFTAAFGGASVAVAAQPGSPQVTEAPVTVPGLGPAAPATGGTPGGAVGGPVGVPGAPGPTATVAPTAVAPTPLRPTRTALSLPGGLSPVLPVLVVLGSILIAGGLRRLPDRVLEHPSAACPLGGQP